MNESALTKKMVERLKDRGAWARKIHGNMYTAGLPDIMAIYRGWGIGIEVKKPGREKTLTELQKKTLEKMENAEGFGRMMTRVEEIDELLDGIDELEDEPSDEVAIG